MLGRDPRRGCCFDALFLANYSAHPKLEVRKVVERRSFFLVEVLLFRKSV